MNIVFISFLLGFALLAGCHGVYRLFAGVPLEDRTYRDKPPRVLGFLWPLIQLAAHYLGWFLQSSTEKKIAFKLRRAGLDHALNARQFFGGKIVAAVIVCGGFYLLRVALFEHLPVVLILFSVVMGFFYPDLWLKEAIDQRNRAIVKTLPFFLDVLTLSVEAGLSFTAALAQSVDKGPDGPLKLELKRVLREVRAGKSRVEAMRELAARIDIGSISSFVSAIVQAETLGVSLGPILRAQADQRRNERFLRAEKLAMEAPVKMLGPLVLFIFPCTFIVLLFPIAMKIMHAGILGS
ncbi:MAG: type II secretion system F family protein [Pseudomonadota bacterium]